MMIETSFYNYRTPDCFEFPVMSSSVLCDSFTTPSLVDENGDFEWV